MRIVTRAAFEFAPTLEPSMAAIFERRGIIFRSNIPCCALEAENINAVLDDIELAMKVEDLLNTKHG